MRIEAVTVCVNYADFLAHTLPINRQIFDRMVVVTTPDDLDTQRLCDHWFVECIVTDAFHTRDGEFRKACGINAGLDRLDLDGWVAHIDADIVLPVHARQILENARLSSRMVYGIDRFNVRGAERWARHQQAPPVQQEMSRCLVHPTGYALSARLNVPHLQGWAPIGFFQLWCPQASGIYRYPEDHAGADRTDMLFACQWDRAHRGFIPEIIAYHLESEQAPQGANWQGRTTKPFTTTTQSECRKPRRRLRKQHVPHVAATGLGAGVTCLAPWPVFTGYWGLIVLLWTLMLLAPRTPAPKGYA